MSINKLIYAVVFALLLHSCKKTELPIQPHYPGEVVTATVNMEPTYKWQIFYSLRTNSIISKNLKTDWDLGFATAADGYSVILNSSKVMFAYNTKSPLFREIRDTNGFTLNKKWDNPNGNLDSTAIGDWKKTHNVYIIDRGYSETGIHQGYRKIQFNHSDDSKYTVRLSNLNGTGDTTLIIKKDSTYNFTFLSLTLNKAVTVEPPKTTWDLAFTQYTHVFYHPTTTYLVTGCLLNTFNTKAAVDSTLTFSNINYNRAVNYNLHAYINTIGYNWKTYSGGTYTTNAKINYIIKNSEGIYYKLHFTDFFNTSGVKGNPKWEFQKL